ncbi:HPP family protein [Ramlibacter sp.]|nr:HPP family protein [Ramlibacter sp.]
MPTTPGQADALAIPAAVPRSRLWMRRFIPGPVGISPGEAWRAALGAGIGLAFAAALCRMLAPGQPAAAWLIAPLGASALLVFVVPASPLAQPWPVIAGNTLSALVGIACVQAFPDPVLAAGVAMAVAVLLMASLRCLHPPGGAAAVLMAVAHVTHYDFAIFPVLMNSLALVGMGLLYNNLTGRPYPRAQVLPADPGLRPVDARRFSAEDLDTALARYNQVLDIGRADLQVLLEEAEMAAYQRKLGALRCADVMSRAPVSVPFGASLQEAWDLMHARRIKALPVLDRAQRICGIVTTADFMRLDSGSGVTDLQARLRAALKPSGSTHSERPEVVGQIMTRSVRVASGDSLLADLIPVFAHDGHHHIPVIDGQQRLVGMITQSDVVRALYHAPAA